MKYNNICAFGKRFARARSLVGVVDLGDHHQAFRVVNPVGKNKSIDEQVFNGTPIRIRDRVIAAEGRIRRQLVGRIQNTALFAPG